MIPTAVSLPAERDRLRAARLLPAAGFCALLVILFLSPASTASAQTAWTYADLVRRLVDLEHPARLPADGERCQQWSSWDRSSRYDEATGKYVDWDANDDGPQFIRQEGDQVVMAEMEGPGCIWRIWSALAEQGRVKIYLDGADEPAVDLPFVNYFSGDTAPFAYPLLSYNLADLDCRGQNLYLPIPYQKSCRVIAEPGWGRYYQFTYTTYPPGTRLPTFSTQLAGEHAAELQAVNDFFRDSLGSDPAARRAGEQTEEGTLWLEAGGAETLEIAGPRAITAIRGKIAGRDREDEMAALRSVVVKITWDGDPQPAVCCPLGDFFGTAPGRNLYKTLATGMAEDHWYALWYMPFARQARIELVNEGQVGREIEYQVVHAPLPQPVDQWARFHCKWHRDTKPLPADRWPDWMLLDTQGRGRFCGVMLHVWNPLGGWWGEGDEKFFVDGEKFPSTFGTGSEDYFGYAWCHPGLFQRPYHAQTMTQGNQGHQSVLRWQLVDNVPFQESFEGVIEKYYRTEEQGTQYACTVAWYLAPGGIDPYGAVPVVERHGYYASPPLVAGGYGIVGRPRGQITTQGMAGFGGTWAGDDQLWWTGAQPGDKLEIEVPVEQAGRYRVSLLLTKALDYGIVRFSWDGRQIGEPVDLYHPQVIRSEPVVLGEFPLDAGTHQLTVEIAGANPQAIAAYMFGLDQVLLERVD